MGKKNKKLGYGQDQGFRRENLDRKNSRHAQRKHDAMSIDDYNNVFGYEEEFNEELY